MIIGLELEFQFKPKLELSLELAIQLEFILESQVDIERGFEATPERELSSLDFSTKGSPNTKFKGFHGVRITIMAGCPPLPCATTAPVTFGASEPPSV